MFSRKLFFLLSQALRGKPTPVWPIKQSQKPQGLFMCLYMYATVHVYVLVGKRKHAHETQTMFVYVKVAMVYNSVLY